MTDIVEQLERACGYENITAEVRTFQSAATNGLVLDAAAKIKELQKAIYKQEVIPEQGKFSAIATIDERELAIRMTEAALGIKRPPGKTTVECLNSFPADWGEAFHRSARAAMAYWRECIDAAKKPH